MTTYPHTSKLTKGAIIGLDYTNPLASVVIFQYNPKKLKRQMQSSAPGKSEGKGEPTKLMGPPSETIDITIEIDAADQLEHGKSIAANMGIHPQLAALEMLLYPKRAHVLVNAALSLFGSIEIVPPEAPLALFIWGAKRILPVNVKSFSIREETHDSRLNPIQAEVDINMQVLTYNDFGTTHPGFYLALTNHVVKEAMAVVALASHF